MRDGGLICKKREKGRTWFRSNPECPVGAELQSLVSKLAARSPGGETILVVEDQPATAQITKILLESWGYIVLEAHGAQQALDVFELKNGEIDLLLTDVIMPGRSGAELAAELWRRKPDLRVVFMSGYPSHELSRTDAAFLAKPFTPASLSKMIRTQLEGAEPVRPGSL
jgi:CheY-like chemotaxis protein